MLNIGLTSVTFRNLSCSEIVAYCKKCGIGYIEWGCDVYPIAVFSETKKT